MHEYSIFLVHFWTDYPFSTKLPFHLNKKWVVYIGLFLDFFVPCVNYLFIFVLVPPYCFNYGSVISIEIKYYQPSNFVLHFQSYFGYSRSFAFSLNFENSLLTSTKILLGFKLRLHSICRSVWGEWTS